MEDWGQFQSGTLRGRWKKALKNSILWNLHRDEAIRTQCDKDESGSAQRPLSKTSVRKFNSATQQFETHLSQKKTCSYGKFQ